MNHTINQHEYTYLRDALTDAAVRKSYVQLVQQTFRLDFEPWFQSVQWNQNFIPSVLLDGERVIASVAVCINDISRLGQDMRYVQVSTVATEPDYRNKGLSRFLMDAVLDEWRDKCDAIYLLANDTVVDFYPKFGFEVCHEFQYSRNIQPTAGAYRKLDRENPADWRLILEKYELGNPFSEVCVMNRSLFIFHCLHGFSDQLYYLPEVDALAIVAFEKDYLICKDVFTNADVSLEQVLAIIANENTNLVHLGFTPKSKEGFNCEVLQEPDTHLFVLQGKLNIFKEAKVMLPLSSRA